jgi:phenylpropionate dioxygenase-like ring-hydroxylating dioxygenase large terminal subunit
MPMNRYRGNVEAVRNLIRETEVHRDVYIDEEVFQLEMEHLFANTWVYVGHDSQVPNEGDYFGTTVGTQPILMVRHTDNTVKVLHNRCPHKGTRITTETCGNTGKFFRCPYHAWTYRNDGRLAGLPFHAEAYGGEDGFPRQDQSLLPVPRLDVPHRWHAAPDSLEQGL